MEEREFWGRLEYRIGREFAGMADGRLRTLWCAGFIPGGYFVDDPTPRITGAAWICHRDRQEEWEFTLFLPQPTPSREAVDWAALFRPENVTCWLALDFSGKRLQIEPSAAVPNLT